MLNPEIEANNCEEPPIKKSRKEKLAHATENVMTPSMTKSKSFESDITPSTSHKGNSLISGRTSSSLQVDVVTTAAELCKAPQTGIP